jgi:hypothetical protein
MRVSKPLKFWHPAMSKFGFALTLSPSADAGLRYRAMQTPIGSKRNDNFYPNRPADRTALWEARSGGF